MCVEIWPLWEHSQVKQSYFKRKTTSHFTEITTLFRLPKDQFAIEGAPNFRQVPGFLVFGTGQPTKNGFKLALEHLLQTGNTGAQSVLWTNMRQVFKSHYTLNLVI